MKILMLNPPFLPKFSRSSRSPAVTKGGTFYYPYYLAYATGVLEQNNFEVKVVDAIANEWNHEKTLDFVKKLEPDLIVIDTSTPSIYNDVNFGTKIKLMLPNTHITLVGTHPTALPEETLKLGKIDSVCRGEYDYTIRDLATTLEKNKKLYTIAGLSYKDGGRIRHNKPREFIKNLDELPFVSEVYKKHLDIEKYFYASLTHPQVTILTARGCPYNCSFCNAPFKHSYRTRSIENVVEEFEYIMKELPEVNEVMIEDETFPAVKKRTIDLCDLMISAGVRLRWSCNARVNTDFETLKKMKEAGCRLMCVGFESPRQHILDIVHKKTTRNMQEKFMVDCRKLNLLVNGCFILGLPNDTKKSIKATVDFAKKLNPDTAQFYPLMVYPGTEAYNWAKSNNHLTTEDYSKWLTKEGLHNTTISRPDISSKELVRLCDQARKEFYLRPSYITSKILQAILHPTEIKRNLMASRTFFKYIFRGTFSKM